MHNKSVNRLTIRGAMSSTATHGRHPCGMRRSLALLACMILASHAYGLDNGVARTPPMGFNAFNFIGFLCSQPNGVDNWKMIGRAMVANGMMDAGYVYVNTDGGNSFSSSHRNSSKAPDLKGVADYLHGIGMKMGVYIFPPYLGYGHEKSDADYMASIGVDFLKYDGWSGTSAGNFTAMRDALLACGRPIVYSVNGAQGPDIAHMWRTSGDIVFWWKQVIGCAGTNSHGDGKPGGWGDPDILEVGNLQNDTMDMTHFSLWCVSSSPLMAGNDPRAMFLSTHYILLNTEAIAVNQDTAFSVNPSYGGAGKLLKTVNGVQIWCKTVTGGAKAVVLANTGSYPYTNIPTLTGTVTWSDIGLPAGVAQVRDLWEHKNLGPFTDKYSAEIPPYGCKFLKIVAGSDLIPEPPATWFPKPPDAVPVTPLPTTGWKATIDVYAYGEASTFIDGNPSTSTAPADPNPKTSVSIDMGSQQTFNCVIVNGIESKSGEDQPSRGQRIGAALKPYKVYETNHKAEVYISQDGVSWQGPVAAGGFGPHNYTYLLFGEQKTRYVKFTHVQAPGNTGNWQQGEWDRYGFKAGIGEIWVANVNPPPWESGVQNRSSTRAPTSSKATPRSVFVSVSQVSHRASGQLPGKAAFYSMQGRRLAAGPHGRSPIDGSGVHITMIRR